MTPKLQRLLDQINIYDPRGYGYNAGMSDDGRASDAATAELLLALGFPYQPATYDSDGNVMQPAGGRYDSNWANNPNGVGFWTDFKNFPGNFAGKTPAEFSGSDFALSHPGSWYDPETGLIHRGAEARDLGRAAADPIGDLVKAGIITAATAGALGWLPGTTSVFAGAPAAGAFPATEGGMSTIQTAFNPATGVFEPIGGPMSTTGALQSGEFAATPFTEAIPSQLVFPGGATSAIGTAPDPSILSGGTTNPGGFMLDPVTGAYTQNAGFNFPTRLPMPGFPQGANMPNAQMPNAQPGFNPLNLIGAASGLNTMFNRSPAVDPALIRDIGQAGRNTYQTSLDPQGDLYKRTQQQLQEQVRAAQSVRGTAMSPYAAGIENKAMSDFNIDWADRQLQRQVQGANAFSGAGNVAANAGVAENAQAFLQNQTGLNNLITALAGTPAGMTYNPATGQWTQAGGNPGLISQAGSWLSNLWANGNQWGSAPQSNFDMSQFADPNFAQNFDYGV